MGLLRIRHHPRVGGGGACRLRRWGRGLELGGGNRGTVGVVILLFPDERNKKLSKQG
jgi:hypothetical protein